MTTSLTAGTRTALRKARIPCGTPARPTAAAAHPTTACPSPRHLAEDVPMR